MHLPRTASRRVIRCSGTLKDRKRSEAAEATASADEARRKRERRTTLTGDQLWWPQETEGMEMKPVSSAYADVNGIKLYYEIYGAGDPLVLIHGGLTTIGEMQGWVQPLAQTRQVIAVEMQGHGHTADTDRPMTLETMGDDIAALLDSLKIPQADVVGHSFGGLSALRAAIQHPDRVRRLVVISAPYARSGWYPEAQEGMSQVGAAMAETLMQTPTGKLSQHWPEPQ